jgi:hypothetical protein
MKVQSKITLFVTAVLLVGSTACAYTLFAPSVEPNFPLTHRLTESVTPVVHEAIMGKIPAAQLGTTAAHALDREITAARFIDSAA